MVEGTQAAHVYTEQGQNPSRKVRDGPRTWNHETRKLTQWVDFLWARPNPFFWDESRTIQSAFCILQSAQWDRFIELGRKWNYYIRHDDGHLNWYMCSNLPFRSVKSNGEKNMSSPNVQRHEATRACIRASSRLIMSFKGAPVRNSGYHSGFSTLDELNITTGAECTIDS